MLKQNTISFFIAFVVLLFTITWANPVVSLNDSPPPAALHFAGDSDKAVVLKYPIKDQSQVIPSQNDYNGGLYLNNPSNIKTQVEYDPASNKYNVTQKMGSVNYRPDNYMTQDEFIDYELKKSMKEYWKQRSNAESMSQQGGKGTKNLIPPIKINSQLFDRIFGSNVVDIRPQGSAELIFGVNSSYSRNPSISIRNQRVTSFNFDQKIQLSLLGKIGDRLKITANYNTAATLDFEQKMKLEYVGGEDDIIKKLEAGNVSLPLNSTLISGSQSLFGIKTQLQFGKATVTTVFSQEKAQKKEINIENGAQTSLFEINADNYESNKHYFLSQHFKNQYDSALKNLPVVNSAINITKVEVWITNTSSNITDTRNIIAFTDLGENKKEFISHPSLVNANASPVPDNSANSLNPVVFANAHPLVRDKDKVSNTLTGLGYIAVQDFEKVLSARRLSAGEFSFNPRLGFISLSTNINPDQVIAVAYQYTQNNVTYQVGELSTDGVADPQCLVVKLLKSQNVNPKRDVLLWDLMMKNVYSMNSYQVKPTNFKLDVLYNNPSTGVDIPVLPETGLKITGKPLIQVMNLDRVNTSGDATPDGIFDFIDGITINASNGKIYFPVREPFGSHLRKKINPTGSPTLKYLEEKYAYDQLYDSTKFIAQQFPDRNRFRIKGSYKSESGSEISLNALNIPEGSVQVAAGGVPLIENQDYTVDYNIGKVKIINDGILRSGTPIKVSFENNLFMSFQQKSLYGTHIDYRVSKDFNLGATAIHLNERPLLQKVTIGDEPVKNTVVGMDGNYSSEMPFLTRMVDKLPFYSTKETSTINVSGEVAALIPGHSKIIGKEGNSYIDDFEGSQSPIDIKNYTSWSLASTPQGKNPLWPEGSKNDSSYGFNRARLAWYTIDNALFQNSKSTQKPKYYTPEMISDNYQRFVGETELFPKKQSPTGIPVQLQTLDLAFYPDERGQYNYDAAPTPFSSGTNPTNGKLKNPKTRWGGIMRKIDNNDFEASNIEFIQLWVMDPFNADLGSPVNNLQKTSGELIVQLGNVSEDVLRDGKNSYENGLPTSAGDPTHPVQTTSWGTVPKVQAIVNAFDNDPSTRSEQDVGLDGLKDSEEKKFFTPFLSSLQALGSGAYNSAVNDPSSDYYHHFTGDDYDKAEVGTLERYKYFNGLENNSPINTNNQVTSSTTLPNTEDINRDNNLNENEGYYQYRVKISPSDLSPTNVGFNYINDVASGNATTPAGSKEVKWYQLRIPVRQFEAQYGQIQDFRSIRFLRLLLKGFDKPVVLRFARVDLIRGEWRKYDYDISSDGEQLGNDDPGTTFNLSAVNYQENGEKKPVNYVLPPKIEQQLSYGTANPVRMNEQSIALKVCNLEDGKSRAAYKNVTFDVRSYKKLRMFVHAEAQAGGAPIQDNNITCFIRLGSDYTQNYYEYEIPLKITPTGYYENNSEDARYQVWRKENEMELVFTDLQNAKQKRNAEIYNNAASLTKRFLYTLHDPEGNPRNIYIKGNPVLSEIRTIMVGVRNPKKTGPGVDDDGLPKCAEVWVNELRLSEFDESGGWASTARITTKLADLGSLSLAGNYSTPGWGSIDKKVSERQRETKYQYDVSAQLQLNKFLPDNWRISLPMYIGYSQAIIRPQFNPLDPDIYLKNAIANLPNDSLKQDLKYRTIDQTDRKSINFMNVKKDRAPDSKRNYFFDIENFAFNYSYSFFHNHGAKVKFNDMHDYRTGMVYSYSTNPKNIQPFSKIPLFNKKVFTLIRDFNFNPYPDKYSFLLDIERHYAQRLNRNTSGIEFPMDTFFDKKFTMLRSYDLKYDIARSLKLDFHADNNSRVLEPFGAIDTQAERDSIKKSLFKGGDNTLYTQRAKVDYSIPINKFPLLDWVNANASYGTDYKWTRAPYSADSLGSFLQNGNQQTLTMQGNFTSLYNKVPFLRQVNQGIKKKEKKKGEVKKVQDSSQVSLTPPTNPLSKTKQDSIKKSPLNILAQYAARSLMMLKNASFNITNNEGTSLAGYKHGTRLVGLTQDQNNALAPGAGFIFGKQTNFGDAHVPFTEYAAEKEWLVKSKTLNTPFTQSKTLNISGRANMEPLPGFKIELSANKNQSTNTSEFFRWAYDTASKTDKYMRQSPVESGNFNMSFNTWATAFEKTNSDYVSHTFTNFLNYREIISNRMAAKNNHPGGAGFAPGYGPTSQNVLFFSFLAAYSGKNPESYTLNSTPTIPIPNWRITYDGLGKIAALKKIFKIIMLSHAYRSSYSYSYTNNLNSKLEKAATPTTLDINGNYIFFEQMNSVTIAEQLSPLIKIDVTLQNNVQVSAEIKKERNLVLSFANNQLTEVKSNEFVIGSGYKWKNLELKNPFNKSKSKNKKPIKSDLNIRGDFSIRENSTLIRKVTENVTQPTAGQLVYTLKTSADYQLTQRITARLFYDWNFNNPKISTSFESKNTNAGVSIRFSLM